MHLAMCQRCLVAADTRYTGCSKLGHSSPPMGDLFSRDSPKSAQLPRKASFQASIETRQFPREWLGWDRGEGMVESSLPVAVWSK